MSPQPFSAKELQILASAGDLALLLTSDLRVAQSAVCDPNWEAIPVDVPLARLVPAQAYDALALAHAQATHGQPGDALTQFFRSTGDVWIDWRTGKYGDSGLVLLVGREVTREVESLNALRAQASMDALTGLPNRSSLTRELLRNVAQWDKDGEPFSLAFIDLDGFKRINDSLGHPVGDTLLMVAAKRLRQQIRPQDFLARMGGDEFVVVMPGLLPEEAAQQVGRKIVAAMQLPFRLDNKVLYIGASIGIVGCPIHGDDPVRLLSYADIAMYQSKATGKGRVTLFSEQWLLESSSDIGFDSALHEGLTNGEFRLVYQPIVDAATCKLDGVEALMRWKKGGVEEISPALFIPVAESLGLIGIMGAWAMRSACREMVQVTGSEAPGPYVSVNVSPRQFRDDRLLQVVTDALEFSGLPASRLQLEITEGALVQDPEAAAQMLQSLRELGVRVAVDDFGTGYSSLAYLKKFPLTTLKIDRAFVKDLPLAPKDRAICSSVCAMARDLGLTAVAEGVETTAQLEMLRDMGCTGIQGYLTGRPAPLESIFAIHSENKVAQ